MGGPWSTLKSEMWSSSLKGC